MLFPRLVSPGKVDITVIQNGCVLRARVHDLFRVT
jgi:hypothetical protein